MQYLLNAIAVPTPDQPIEDPHNPVAKDRRMKIRYPLELPISFRTLDQAFSGEGEVVNMSSNGILILTGRQPKVGAQLEMRIAWPWLLDQKVALQFIATGRVVRRAELAFAVLFRHHQFRTVAGKLSQAAANGR